MGWCLVCSALSCPLRGLAEARRLVEDGREPFRLGGRERLVLGPKHLLHARDKVAAVSAVST